MEMLGWQPSRVSDGSDPCGLARAVAPQGSGQGRREVHSTEQRHKARVISDRIEGLPLVNTPKRPIAFPEILLQKRKGTLRVS